jgi:integrase
MPLKPEHVKAAIAESIDNPKFTRIADGLSLYLMTRNGRGYWQFNYKTGGKVRSKMLGSAADFSPTQARNAKNSFNVHRKDSADEQPRRSITVRQAPAVPERRGITIRKANPGTAQPGSKLFGEVVDLFLSEFAPGWTGGIDGREAAAYRRQLTDTDFARLPVAEIQTPDVEAMLKQWSDTPATAEKILMRVGKILSYAKAKEYRSGDNPAAIKGHFEFLARPVVPTVNHHPAMKSADVPSFMRELLADGSTPATALAFTILTAARTKESIRAKWKEIDGTVWTCPADRMKGKQGKRLPHSVPLAPAVLKLLGKRGAPDDYIFPSNRGPRTGLWLSSMREALDRLRGKRLSIEGLPPVVHGMRSTFSDWAAEAGYPQGKGGLIDRALAHSDGKTVSAYQRTKLIELRRPMMNAWNDFAMSKV